MTDSEYGLAWLIYLCSSLGVFVVMWWLTRRWLVPIRYASRAIIAALLFTPWINVTEQQLFAPALTIVFFSMIDGDMPAAIRGLIPMLWVALGLLLLSIPVHMWTRRQTVSAQ